MTRQKKRNKEKPGPLTQDETIFVDVMKSQHFWDTTHCSPIQCDSFTAWLSPREGNMFDQTLEHTGQRILLLWLRPNSLVCRPVFQSSRVMRYGWP